METFSALLAHCEGNSPVTGEFPSQRPVTRSFDVFFDQRLHKRLSKQSWGWWFETPSRSFWRHYNVCTVIRKKIVFQDDIMTWKRPSTLLALCGGNSTETGGFPSQMVSEMEFSCFLFLSTNDHNEIDIQQPCIFQHSPVIFKRPTIQCVAEVFPNNV